MTDDGKGGSGAGAGAAAGVPPAAGDGAGKEPKTKAAKFTIDAVMAENEALRQEVKAQKDVITDLTGQLKETTDLLESQEKTRLIGEIMPRSSYKHDDLADKSIEELKSIRATLDQARPPNVNSVRFGVPAADLSDREKGLTVGDLSYSTAQKRKAAAGVA